MKVKNVLMMAYVVSVLVACQNVDNVEPYSPQSQDEVAFLSKYTKNFESKFGPVNASHDWGFGLQPLAGGESATRASYVNSNEWVTKYHFDVPGGLSDNQGQPWGWAHGDVTNYERAYVYWWFSTHRWPVTTEVNWSDYFIEYVWGQPEHSGLNGDGTRANDGGAHFGMDQIRSIKQGLISSNPASNINASNADEHLIAESGNYEHVSDFNAGGNTREQVMYEANASTLDFLYNCTYVNGFHNNWTLQYINGSYYLAFDYWHKEMNSGTGEIVYKDNNPVGADGYYNDWILKLTNGIHTVDNYTRRVMCEDLGNTFDWDFNDVVFDVTTFVEGNDYYAMITLQAAGGTKKIYVGDLEHREKHKRNEEDGENRLQHRLTSSRTSEHQSSPICLIVSSLIDSTDDFALSPSSSEIASAAPAAFLPMARLRYVNTAMSDTAIKHTMMMYSTIVWPFLSAFIILSVPFFYG